MARTLNMIYCPKCGRTMVGPRYHKSGADCWPRQFVDGEHLHYDCVCGFDDTRLTKDAPGALDAALRKAGIDA